MKQSILVVDTKGKSKELCDRLNVIENAKLANLLFFIGSFLTIIQLNEAEKAVFQTMTNTSGTNKGSDSEVKAAKIAETASIIFLTAVIINAINAMTILRIQLNDFKSSSNTKSKVSNITGLEGSKIVAFFDLLKVIAYIGAAVGYHINAVAAQKK